MGYGPLPLYLSHYFTLKLNDCPEALPGSMCFRDFRLSDYVHYPATDQSAARFPGKFLSAPRTTHFTDTLCHSGLEPCRGLKEARARLLTEPIQQALQATLSQTPDS